MKSSSYTSRRIAGFCEKLQLIWEKTTSNPYGQLFQIQRELAMLLSEASAAEAAQTQPVMGLSFKVYPDVKVTTTLIKPATTTPLYDLAAYCKRMAEHNRAALEGAPENWRSFYETEAAKFELWEKAVLEAI